MNHLMAEYNNDWYISVVLKQLFMYLYCILWMLLDQIQYGKNYNLDKYVLPVSRKQSIAKCW